MDTSKFANALRSVILIFLAGRPGAGKELTGDHLLKELDKSVRIVTSEEIDRFIAQEDPDKNAVAKNIVTAMEAGRVVPDEYVIPIILARIAELQAEGYSRIILDGFPRTKEQDKRITELTERFVMCYLDIDVDLAIERMIARGRKGETPEKCRFRQQVFEESTLPVVDQFAVLHPLHFLEIDSGKAEAEERARIIKERVLSTESSFVAG